MATVEKYQTSTGATLYRVRYRTPDRRQTQKRGFATKRDAELFAATVEVAKARGEYVAPAVGRITIGELGRPGWTASAATSSRPAPAPTRAPGGPTSRRSGPTSRIADIRYSDVAAWVAELSAVRGPVTVRMAYWCCSASWTMRCATGCWCPTRPAA